MPYSVATFIDGEPLISVITPVYNGAEYLEELILSVQEQDYPHVEHIIIDDGSNDDGATIAVLKRFPHVRWWSRENRGQYATLNEGMAAARGSVIGVIAADDIYVTPSAFSSVIDFWRAHPEYGCVYGRTLRMDSSGMLLPSPALPEGPVSPRALRYSLKISHCSLFVARSLVQERGIEFDSSFRYAGDWDWIIRLSQAAPFGYLDRPLSVYREHPSQATQQAGQQNLTRETERILDRYRSSRFIYRSLIYRHRLYKGWWLLRNQGVRGLLDAVRIRLGRR